jgi:aspartyl-tRNA(Asn)/glutamyl-tRNA(Gln) amidotransferase subunit B
MRSKEFAHDYRYFPEPDLLPVHATQALVETIRGAMPELPDARRGRFIEQYGITLYEAGVLTAARNLADYFESSVRAGAPPKSAASWISVELLRHLNDSGKDIADSPLPPTALAELLSRIETGEITAATGKKVFARMFETGQTAAIVIAAEGFSQISDAGQIENVARAIIEKNAANVAKYRAGNEGVFKFFVGQVMRETRGQANPQLVNDVLKRLLGEI